MVIGDKAKRGPANKRGPFCSKLLSGLFNDERCYRQTNVIGEFAEIPYILHTVKVPRIEASFKLFSQPLRMNRLIASSVTGSKRLIRFPSGSRNSIARFPHGIVVGSFTHSSTNGFKRSYSASI